MSESTDTTQVLPLAESPQAQVDPDATVTIPVVQPVAPAVAVPYDARRAHLMHQHRVLGRILSTASLPTPDQVTMHTYGNGIELLIHDTLDGTALGQFVAVFGGTPRTSDNESKWAASGRARYAELLTVVDGVDVRVWSLTDLPAAEQPEAAPVEAVAEPVAAEPEPEHNPAPTDRPTETPAEHPEAA